MTELRLYISYIALRYPIIIDYITMLKKKTSAINPMLQIQLKIEQ